MNFKSIIISGDIGTGTTTLAEGLAERLGWSVLSFGIFFRQYVKEHAIPLWDKLSVPKEWEYKMDKTFQDKIRNEEKIIFEGHYQAWLAQDKPETFKILLVCEPHLAAARILSRVHTHEETEETIQKRRQGIRDSFQKLYGAGDYFDPKLFHLVIDTGENSVEQTLAKAYSEFTLNRRDWC